MSYTRLYTRKIQDDHVKAVFFFYREALDDNGDVDEIRNRKVDISQLYGYNSAIINRIAVSKLTWSMSSGTGIINQCIRVYWEGTEAQYDIPIISLNGYYGRLDFTQGTTDCVHCTNGVDTNITGNIIFSTDGFTSKGNYSFFLELVKYKGFDNFL